MDKGAAMVARAFDVRVGRKYVSAAVAGPGKDAGPDAPAATPVPWMGRCEVGAKWLMQRQPWCPVPVMGAGANSCEANDMGRKGEPSASGRL
jgi:hypothetical protein